MHHIHTTLIQKKDIIYKITQSHYKPHTTVPRIFFSKLQDSTFTPNFIFNLIDRFVWTYSSIIVYACIFHIFCIILLFHSIFLYETCLIRTSIWPKLLFGIDRCTIYTGVLLDCLLLLHILINLLQTVLWSPIIFILIVVVLCIAMYGLHILHIHVCLT
jgi:hypothetical protein